MSVSETELSRDYTHHRGALWTMFAVVVFALIMIGAWLAGAFESAPDVVSGRPAITSEQGYLTESAGAQNVAREQAALAPAAAGTTLEMRGATPQAPLDGAGVSTTPNEVASPSAVQQDTAIAEESGILQ
ncbi:hypothetical protein BFP70_08090 [Thioclava sp. SK-1]|uniref:hypothetical protein n=1 Tax=Thioclava sp. SK-1 TaxID=1889770 RepID=UPI0008260717|nr:hypothetical protein [Thioclava sp. SK-1]OCX66063.1 hypothetical protein BFP70_08090 [Thioclava sp. SK-1]